MRNKILNKLQKLSTLTLATALVLTSVYIPRVEAAENSALDIGLNVEARYNSNHVRWNDVQDAANYKIYRKVNESAAETELITVTDVSDKTSYDYIDTTAGKGTQCLYRIEWLSDTTTVMGTTELIKDKYKTGVRAVQQHAKEEQLHYDFKRDFNKSTSFGGNRAETILTAQLNGVENLESGTVFVSFKRGTAIGNTPKYLWGFGRVADFPENNLNTGNSIVTSLTGTNNVFKVTTKGTSPLTFTLNSGVTNEWLTFCEPVFASGSANKFGIAWKANSSVASAEYKNSTVYDGFLKGLNTATPFECLTIGGVESETGSVYNGFEGDIAYLTITDEEFRTDSQTAEGRLYVTDLTAKINTGVDFALLEDKIEEAETINGDMYTTESYTTLLNAIDHAEVVADKTVSVTQTDITNEVTALQTAIDGLVYDLKYFKGEDSTADTWKVPTAPEGKAFVGWYENPELTRRCTSEKLTGSAYPRFATVVSDRTAGTPDETALAWFLGGSLRMDFNVNAGYAQLRFGYNIRDIGNEETYGLQNVSWKWNYGYVGYSMAASVAGTKWENPQNSSDVTVRDLPGKISNLVIGSLENGIPLTEDYASLLASKLTLSYTTPDGTHVDAVEGSQKERSVKNVVDSIRGDESTKGTEARDYADALFQKYGSN